MRITELAKNRALQFATIAGISAAIATYLIIGIVAQPGSVGQQNAGLHDTGNKSDQKSVSGADLEIREGNMIAALPIDDFATLKQVIKNGTRLNVIGVSSSGQTNPTIARTILTNIKVVAIPTVGNAELRDSGTGVLVSLTQDECERLFGFLSTGKIRVVVAKASL